MTAMRALLIVQPATGFLRKSSDMLLLFSLSPRAAAREER